MTVIGYEGLELLDELFEPSVRLCVSRGHWVHVNNLSLWHGDPTGVISIFMKQFGWTGSISVSSCKILLHPVPILRKLLI